MFPQCVMVDIEIFTTTLHVPLYLYNRRCFGGLQVTGLGYLITSLNKIASLVYIASFCWAVNECALDRNI